MGINGPYTETHTHDVLAGDLNIDHYDFSLSLSPLFGPYTKSVKYESNWPYTVMLPYDVLTEGLNLELFFFQIGFVTKVSPVCPIILLIVVG